MNRRGRLGGVGIRRRKGQWRGRRTPVTTLPKSAPKQVVGTHTRLFRQTLSGPTRAKKSITVKVPQPKPPAKTATSTAKPNSPVPEPPHSFFGDFKNKRAILQQACRQFRFQHVLTGPVGCGKTYLLDLVRSVSKTRTVINLQKFIASVDHKIRYPNSPQYFFCLDGIESLSQPHVTALQQYLTKRTKILFLLTVTDLYELPKRLYFLKRLSELKLYAPKRPQVSGFGFWFLRQRQQTLPPKVVSHWAELAEGDFRQMGFMLQFTERIPVINTTGLTSKERVQAWQTQRWKLEREGTVFRDGVWFYRTCTRPKLSGQNIFQECGAVLSGRKLAQPLSEYGQFALWWGRLNPRKKYPAMQQSLRQCAAVSELMSWKDEQQTPYQRLCPGRTMREVRDVGERMWSCLTTPQRPPPNIFPSQHWGEERKIKQHRELHQRMRNFWQFVPGTTREQNPDVLKLTYQLHFAGLSKETRQHALFMSGESKKSRFFEEMKQVMCPEYYL